MQEDQWGPISDRTREHLGTTDLAVIATRRKLLRQVRDLQNVTEPLEPPRLHELVHRVREHTGVPFVPIDRAGLRRALAHLRAGGALGVLADRDVLGTGRPLPFFGERAALPWGAVELARRSGAALVTGFVYRSGVARYRVVIDPAIAIPRTDDREADTREGMRLLVARLERGIRRAPEQWFPLSPVWSGISH